mmetsp:Transcript_60945/g.131058  ORF Transcript_60945/g.131058 Transcript_60945/m.131058 type:complete len:216 (+) Transcript_60945:85-732(+)
MTSHSFRHLSIARTKASSSSSSSGGGGPPVAFVIDAFGTAFCAFSAPTPPAALAAVSPGRFAAGALAFPFRMSKASSSVMFCSRFAALNSFAPLPLVSSTCQRDLWSSKKVRTPSRPLSSGRACNPQTLTCMPTAKLPASGSSLAPGLALAGGGDGSPPGTGPPAACAPAPGDPLEGVLGTGAAGSFTFFWNSANALKEGMAPSLSRTPKKISGT